MNITAAAGSVTISRLWFKDGGGASYNNYGGAISIDTGTLTLESCIFSGNQTGYPGGAISNRGTLNVKGCTFVSNSSPSYNGGAIYSSSGTLTLTGNLFYGNTANSYPVVYRGGGTVSSGGYNVVDVALGGGSAYSGWTAVTGDTTIEDLLGANTTSPFIDIDTLDLAPKSELSIIPADFADNMPATDFYGNTRTWPGAPGAVK
jgi:predicted outer membrane repeat protein